MEAPEKCMILISNWKTESTYQLNKVISEMAAAIRSIYLVRHQVPLNIKRLMSEELLLNDRRGNLIQGL